MPGRQYGRGIDDPTPVEWYDSPQILDNGAGEVTYFTETAFRIDVTVVGRNPNAAGVVAIPTAALLSSSPIDGDIATLQADVPTQSVLVVPVA